MAGVARLDPGKGLASATKSYARSKAYATSATPNPPRHEYDGLAHLQGRLSGGEISPRPTTARAESQPLPGLRAARGGAGRRVKAIIGRHPWLPYLAPFVLFAGLTGLQPYVPGGVAWVYPAKTVLTALLIFGLRWLLPGGDWSSLPRYAHAQHPRLVSTINILPKNTRFRSGFDCRSYTGQAARIEAVSAVSICSAKRCGRASSARRALVGRAAQRVGGQHDPVAVVDRIHHRRQDADIGLRAGDHQRVGAAAAQLDPQRPLDERASRRACRS